MHFFMWTGAQNAEKIICIKITVTVDDRLFWDSYDFHLDPLRNKDVPQKS